MTMKELTDTFNARTTKALSLEDSLALFDELADNPDIAFGYAPDGCYARAHLMCQKIIDHGLLPKKAWAFEGKNYLHVDMPNGKKIQWSWHVALALPVQTPDGKVEDMVFDPGLFDGPVTLQEWGQTIHAHPEKLQIAPYGAPPKGYSGDYIPYGNGINADQNAKDTMIRYRRLQDRSPRVLFSTPARQQFCDTRFTQQGKTWISAAVAATVSATVSATQRAAPAERPPPASLNR